MEKYIGIDVGGGSLRASLIDKQGNLYTETSSKTNPSWKNEDFLNAISELLKDIFKNHEEIFSIGIGTPGPIDIEKGLIIHSANLKNLQNTPLVEFLQSKFKTRVFFNNDANCAALGEYFFGKGKGSENLITLTLGTGLGCGWVYQGKIFNGFHGSGMEAGHTTLVIEGAECGCGKKGCAESYFSATGLKNRYREKTGLEIESAEAFFGKVEKGDRICQEILSFATKVLAQLIRNLCHTLNQDKVVLVGGLTKSFHLFEKQLKAELFESLFPILGERLSLEIGGSVAGSYGAAALAFA
ncbi:MAG: ROK family protein [Leptospiraceae bacterium]|nr:ROK family protein [Leptospiraceae bacterium]MCP5501190.1 ROK family protein [Leptospiraceae bacterium]